METVTGTHSSAGREYPDAPKGLEVGHHPVGVDPGIPKFPPKGQVSQETPVGRVENFANGTSQTPGSGAKKRRKKKKSPKMTSPASHGFRTIVKGTQGK